MNSGSISTGVQNDERSTTDLEAVIPQSTFTSDEVIVLDGAKLKSLIKDYARECIKEELANVLKMLS